MEDKITKIEEQILKELKNVISLDKLNEIRVKALGKKSEFSMLLKEMVNLSGDERKELGKRINETKNLIKDRIDEAALNIKENIKKERIKKRKYRY